MLFAVLSAIHKTILIRSTNALGIPYYTILYNMEYNYIKILYN